MHLRPAAPDDAPRLREIARAAYARYVDRMGRESRPMTQDYADVIRDLDVTVAEDDGEIVGLLALEHDDVYGLVVDNVAVDPARLGTGIGRTLLERAEQVARDEGREDIVLYTHTTMTENLALYGRIGYEEFAREPSPPGEIVLMRKPLA